MQQATPEIFPDIDRQMRRGLAAGGVAEFSLTPHFWLRIEPMYVQKGSEEKWEGILPEGEEFTYELDYFVVPANMKATLNIGFISPYVFSGMYLAGVMSGEMVSKSDRKTYKTNQETLDLGLDFGGGADIRLRGSLWLTLDARYSLGLTDTRIGSDWPLKNRGVIVLGGILLEL